jgi:HK97 family phage major capsid protein
VPYLDEVLERISAELAELNEGKAPDVFDFTKERERRRGSRFANEHASREWLEHVASGGDTRTVRPSVGRERGTKGLARSLKALAEGSGSAGGYLVQPELAQEVAQLVRARSVVMQMGPRVFPVKKSLLLSSVSAGATAAYVGENAAIPASEETFAQDTLLSPKNLAALVPVSNRLLRDAADVPDVEQVVQSDLAEVLSLRQDLAFIQGTGTGGEPLGIKNASGLTAAPNLGTDGGTPDFDDLKQTIANVRAANGRFERPGWIFNPRLLSTLEQIKDTTGRYLMDSGMLTHDASGAAGSLLGYRFASSTQVPVNLTTGASTDTTYAIFSSDWTEAWVGVNDELHIDVSGEASYTPDAGTTWINAFQNQQTLFRATMTHDIGLRRPQFFTVLSGIRP